VRHKKTQFVLGGVLAVIIAAAALIHTLNLAQISGGLTLPTATVFAPRSSAQTAGCQTDHPAFYYGFAALHAQLGDVMGNPLECEHAIHANGDTRQRTTTGYAYYRKTDNVPTFTNGWDHWALTTDGLTHWSGYVVDPPTAHAATGQSAQADQ
jgi:hypothetical protein